MATERWTVFKGGVSHTFEADIEVVADFVEPCGYCGVPCSGTIRIWYADGGKRMVFEVDRPLLSELLESLVRPGLGREAYQALPAFVRDWNEHTGWVSLGIMDGAVVDGLDLLATVRALEAQGSGADGRTPALLVALNDFVTRCIREGRELWAGET